MKTAPAQQERCVFNDLSVFLIFSAPRNAKKIVQEMCVRWELRKVHRDVGFFVSAETYRMRRPPQSSTGTIASLN